MRFVEENMRRKVCGVEVLETLPTGPNPRNIAQSIARKADA